MSQVQISLVTGHPNEKWARDQLIQLHETYDLRRWQFTNQVRLQSMVVPHSHPVLTLNCANIGDDDVALSTYLHEQLHWFTLLHNEKCATAGRELHQRYPEVPSFEQGGARDERSTYLHLIVCPLEYRSLIEVIGTEAATAALHRMRHYTWVYETLLAAWPYFDDLLQRNGLTVP